MTGQEIPKVKPPQANTDQTVNLDQWDDIVADRYKVPKSLMKSMASQESGGNVNATSPTGVKGRYQVTESTAKSYGLDRNDPFQQSVAAAKHLRAQYDALGHLKNDDERWLGAVGRYYGGGSAVQGDTLSGGSVDGLSNPAEHVKRVAQKWGELRKSETAPTADNWPKTDSKGRPYQPPSTLHQELKGQAPQIPEGSVYDVGTGKTKPAALGSQYQGAALPKPAPVSVRGGGNVFDRERRQTMRDAREALNFRPVGGNPVALEEQAKKLEARISPEVRKQRDRQDAQRQADAARFAARSPLGKAAEVGMTGFLRGASGLGDVVSTLTQTPAETARNLGVYGRTAKPALTPAAEQALAGQEQAQDVAYPNAAPIARGIVSGAVQAPAYAMMGELGAPAAIAGGAAMQAAQEDWRNPGRAAVRTALGAVAPLAGGAVANRIIAPATTATRLASNVTGGALGNVAQSAAEQAAFEGRINPGELGRAAVIGGALGLAPQGGAHDNGIPRPEIVRPGVAADLALRPRPTRPNVPLDYRPTEAVQNLRRQPTRNLRPQTEPLGEAAATAPTEPMTAPETPHPVSPSPQSPQQQFRALADEAKLNASRFEQAGDLASAATEYQTAHANLKRMAGEMRRAKAGPEEMDAVQREISIADRNAKMAARQARSARPQVQQPQQDIQKNLAQPETAPPQVPLNDAAPTRDLSAPLPEQPSAPRVTRELPRVQVPEPAETAPRAAESDIPVPPVARNSEPLTPPTNRITEGAGGELPRRMSRPLEGQIQPVERPKTEPLTATLVDNSEVRRRKQEIGKLIPFNIQGNKADLLAKGLGGLIERAAKGTKRTIDAFAGSGTYTHYLRSKGHAREGDILNEYEPLRHIAHKQIRDNPEAVGREAERTLNDLRNLTANIREGETFAETHNDIRRQVTQYFRDRMSKLTAEGQDLDAKRQSGEPVEMQDSPETAGLYTIMQNQAFNFLPIQAEMGGKGFKLPGFGVIGNERGKVSLFVRGREQTMNAPGRVRDAGVRLKGTDVRRGDGWELIGKEAGDGDLVPVDTSYLNKGDAVTTNYNKATQEDATPSVYIEKVRKYLLPAWDRGAKLIVTNNWDEGVANYLRSEGFTVLKANRQGASVNEVRQGGAAELIAINFDKRSGQIKPRRDVISGEPAGRTSEPTQQSGSGNADKTASAPLDARTQGQDEAIRGRRDARESVTYTHEEAALRAREALPPIERRRAQREAALKGEYGKFSEQARKGATEGKALAANPQLRRLLDLPEMPEYGTKEWNEAAQDSLNAMASLAGKERSSQVSYLRGDNQSRGEMADVYAALQDRAKAKGEPIEPSLRQAFRETVTKAREFQRGYEEFQVDERVHDVRQFLQDAYREGSKPDEKTLKAHFQQVAAEYGISNAQAERLYKGAQTQARRNAERLGSAAEAGEATGADTGRSGRRLRGSGELAATGTEGREGAEVSAKLAEIDKLEKMDLLTKKAADEQRAVIQAQARKPKFVADAEKRLSEYKSGRRLGSGAEALIDQAIVTGYKVYRAGMDFAAWSAEVVKQLGDEARPHLQRAWAAIQRSEGRQAGQQQEPQSTTLKPANSRLITGPSMGKREALPRKLEPLAEKPSLGTQRLVEGRTRSTTGDLGRNVPPTVPPRPPRPGGGEEPERRRRREAAKAAPAPPATLAESSSLFGKLAQIPRGIQTLKYGGDWSYIFRQAGPISLNPLNVANTAKAFQLAYHATGRENAGNKTLLPGSKGAEWVKGQLESMPELAKAKDSGLELALTSGADEIYKNSKIAQLTPLKRTEAGNEAALDFLRLKEFGRYAKAIEKNSNYTAEQKDAAYKRAAEIVNTLTGRTALGEGKIRDIVNAANGIAGAPRLTISRIKLLDPTRIAREYRANPEVGKRMAKDAFAVTGTLASIMALGNAAGVWNVETDPDSADFGKIRVGTKRYDLGFGELQLLRLFFKTARYGEKIGEDVYKRTPKSQKEKEEAGQKAQQQMGRFLRGRLGPAWSYAYDLWDGKNMIGEPVNLRQAATLDKNSPFMRLVPPMGVTSGIEAVQKEGPKGLATTTLPEFFGVNVQDYETKGRKRR